MNKAVSIEHPAIKFFSQIYLPNSSGEINLRFLPSGKNYFISPREIKRVLQTLKEHSEENSYFQVALCDGHGGKTHIAEIPALWVDVDFKEGFGVSELSKLPGIPLRVSIIVKSGGGIHLYWPLKEPATKDDIPLVENILKRLAQVFRGDPASAEAARILRTPGTKNFKYDPPREVKLIRFEPECRYDLGEFDEILPPLEESHREQEGHNPLGWEKDLLEGVEDGERNVSLSRLAGRYIAKGLSRDEALSILLDVNNRCNPPLEQKELETILDSIMKTHQRNNRLESGSSEKGEPRKEYHSTTIKDVFHYPDPVYLVDEILLKGTVTILSAYTGIGKSIVALSIMKSIATGDPLWRKFPVEESGPVLLIDEETPNELLKMRLKGMGLTPSIPLKLLHFQEVRLDHDEFYAALVDEIRRVNPKLVIFDSLIRFHRKKEDVANEMALVLDRLRKIANMGVTVLVIHHHRKGKGDPREKSRGSSDIIGAVDLEYSLESKEDYLVLSSVKTRMQPVIPMRLQMETEDMEIGEAEKKKSMPIVTGITYLGPEMGEQEEIFAEITDILREKGEADIKEIRENLRERDFEVGINRIRKMLKEGFSRGNLIEKIGIRGKKTYLLNPDSQFHSFTPLYNTGETVKVEDSESPSFTEDPSKIEESREGQIVDSQLLDGSLTSSPEGCREDVKVDEISDDDFREVEI